MAVICLILGESGTGKSASMRNFKQDELALVNVARKPLPFRGNFNEIRTVDAGEIEIFLQDAKEKTIVVDDAQYIMAFQYMRRIKENGWDKYNEIQSDFFNAIEQAKKLPDDVIVFFLSHLETKDDGRQKIKTIGKMLDEKITIEGMFTVVLKTLVSDGKYYFTTQNSGFDTVKSPIGMFPSNVIDNDLKYVAEKIRNYYGMAGAITDEEMAKADELTKAEIAVDAPKQRRRRKQAEATPVEKPAETVTVTVADQKGEDVVEVPVVEDAPAPAPAEAEQPKVRRRKRREVTPSEKSEEIPF